MEHYKEICRNWHNLREGKEKRKKMYDNNTGYSNLVTQPTRSPAKQGLTFLSRREPMQLFANGDSKLTKYLTFKFYRIPVESLKY